MIGLPIIFVYVNFGGGLAGRLLRGGGFGGPIRFPASPLGVGNSFLDDRALVLGVTDNGGLKKGGIRPYLGMSLN